MKIFLIFLFSQSLLASEYAPNDFQRVREEFLATYSPIVKEDTGLDLEINLDTDVPNYFGGMSVKNNIMSITIGSEFDREIGITPKSYLFILCHEVGHLLGGLPKKVIKGPGALYSSEGQSDYFAANVCLKKFLKSENEVISAGQELFHYIHLMYLDFKLDMPEPNIDTPAKDGESLGHEYPSFQCRFDTIVAGAKNASRPACWYRP